MSSQKKQKHIQLYLENFQSFNVGLARSKSKRNNPQQLITNLDMPLDLYRTLSICPPLASSRRPPHLVVVVSDADEDHVEHLERAEAVARVVDQHRHHGFAQLREDAAVVPAPDMRRAKRGEGLGQRKAVPCQ